MLGRSQLVPRVITHWSTWMIGESLAYALQSLSLATWMAQGRAGWVLGGPVRHLGVVLVRLAADGLLYCSIGSVKRVQRPLGRLGLLRLGREAVA